MSPTYSNKALGGSLSDQLKKRGLMYSTLSQSQDPLTERVQGIISQVPTKSDFGKSLSYDTFFNKDIARASARKRSSKYFLPLIDKAVSNIYGDFARRGLFRSGARRQAERSTFEDFADQQARQEEELFNIRDKEARDAYNIIQQQYEDDPTSVNLNEYTTPMGSPVDTEPIDTSPYKYGKTYLDFIKAMYKM